MDKAKLITYGLIVAIYGTYCYVLYRLQKKYLEED